MKHALIASTAYFTILFALGFVLGTLRVTVVAPQFGPLIAVAAELPMMLMAAFFICRWTIRHWQVPSSWAARWAAVIWFLALLFTFEMLLGMLLFGRMPSEQFAALATSEGLLGLFAQLVAATLPLVLGRRVANGQIQ